MNPLEHAVLVQLRLAGRMGTAEEHKKVQDLALKIEELVEASGAGEYDGSEFGDGRCTLYMYGPDADLLFSAVEPVLRSSPAAEGGVVIKRYGSATSSSARETRVEL